MRLADYIAEFLVSHDITNVFSVVGGGAMHLNDAFGHHDGLHVVYNHHEQASAMAAEAYARINNKVALACVTTGPGATNAITGVAGAWMSSIPLLVISGQARYATTVPASGLPLRTRGVQEFDIIGSVGNMTKYCELVTDPSSIRFCLEKALFLANEGRPGPCWLDIPLDVQAAQVNPDELVGFNPSEGYDYQVDQKVIDDILIHLHQAQRPLIFAGNGIRLAGAHDRFVTMVEALGVPVVVGMGSVDALPSDHRLFAGRSGTTGERAGNFALQNADFLLSIGSRQGYFQTGFAFEYWAREAYVVLSDIDGAELAKDSLHADMRVECDALALIEGILDALSRNTDPLPNYESWVKQCTEWRKRYPVVLDKHRMDKKPNIYAFYEALSQRLHGDDVIVADCGTSRVVGSQACQIHDQMRFITNSSMAAMGYDLPAAIGVCVARGGSKTILVTGEGSLQMNIQELQTIVQNKLPIVMFIMNNGGYHSIRMTQRSFFGKDLVGVGPESGDLSFPDLAKLSGAYGIPYYLCTDMAAMERTIEKVLANEGPCLCEMVLSTEQVTEPKVSSKRLPDGRMVSTALEDMAPFLSREELESNMFISIVGE